MVPRYFVSWAMIVCIVCGAVLLMGLTGRNDSSPLAEDTKQSRANILIPVRIDSNETVLQVPLEQYVLGVVAAEMPDRFAAEALKAQAIAARTYVLNKLMESTSTSKDYYIYTDSRHQMYLNPEQLLQKWKRANDLAGLRKIQRAVSETSGQIIIYQNKPIDATYFSTSNGYTENAEDYWDAQVPYLRSVASPWDVTLSNRYRSSKRWLYSDFIKKMGIRSQSPRDTCRSMRVIERTAGHRVKSLQIGNRVISGREFREKMDLQSSHFDWKLDEKHIVITTYGNGHGVGMSQWGAQGMALEGYQAPQIISHYYKGVEIVDLADVYLVAKWQQLLLR